jgi:Spy/CpxP family protein refolding chaperone
MSKASLKSFRLSRGLSLVVAAGALAAAAAIAAAPDAEQGRHDGARMHHVAMHGGGMGMRLGADPARVDRMVERMLHGLNATEAQTTQIQQIARAAAQDLQSQREAHRSLREQLRQAWSQPTVDANAVEALRQQQIALMDQRSKRMSQAMLEISRVLTPEQRTQLAERRAQRHQHMHERGGKGPRGEHGPRDPQPAQ